MSVLILYGSSSAEGHTTRSAHEIARITDGEAIDVGAQGIGTYDYEAHNTEDGFYRISRKMLASDTIVFATPVYWYAMSAQMKIFFDRLNDLTTVRKQDGRALAGKTTYLIANGSEEALPEGFEIPFRRTSDYFAMQYKGAHYLYTGRKNETLHDRSWAALGAFAKQIVSSEENITQRAQSFTQRSQG